MRGDPLECVGSNHVPGCVHLGDLPPRGVCAHGIVDGTSRLHDSRGRLGRTGCISAPVETLAAAAAAHAAGADPGDVMGALIDAELPDPVAAVLAGVADVPAEDRRDRHMERRPTGEAIEAAFAPAVEAVRRMGDGQEHRYTLREGPRRLVLEVGFSRIGRKTCPACGRLRVLFASAIYRDSRVVDVGPAACLACSGLRR